MSNPLLEPSPLEFGFPQFDLLTDEYFVEAFQLGMKESMDELNRIATVPEAPTFENTFVALEKRGQVLRRARTIFDNLVAVQSTPEREKIRTEFATKFAAHDDEVRLNPELFQRIKQVYEAKLSLDPESQRLVKEYYEDCVREGANLNSEKKTELKELNSRLAELETTLEQWVVKGRGEATVYFDNKEDLDGLDDTEVSEAEQLAKEKGDNTKGRYAIELVNTTLQPVLAKLKVRASRKKVFDSSIARGISGGEYDVQEIFTEVLRLRHAKAELLGFKSYSDYNLSDETAGNADAVMNFLKKFVEPAARNVQREIAKVNEVAKKLDPDQFGNGGIEAWDYEYYINKMSSQEYDIDLNKLPPYLEVHQVMHEGLFYAAKKLYDITFKPRFDLPLYRQPASDKKSSDEQFSIPNDVETYDVFDKDGTTKLAIMIVDYYARPDKNGGAWMTLYNGQSRLLNQKPIIGLQLNVSKPKTEGVPALMSWDDVETAFHEFGHGLHGIFSDVNYLRFTSPHVPRDFVEYPSQVNEIWITDRDILSNYLKHYQTKQAPEDVSIIDKLTNDNVGRFAYMTMEYLQSTMLDFVLHAYPRTCAAADHTCQAASSTDFDVLVPGKFLEWENNTLKKVGLYVPQIHPRYHLGYFTHTFAGYSSLYYAYLWSEVLDAHTANWIKENGGCNVRNGDAFRKHILSAGNSRDPVQQFLKLVGASEPDVNHLLKRKHMLD
ncbi:peptidyl-dipeptidase [Gregarina niphandrodes]|uniref:Peptidyl-dipeptidase n=1 Tax=Gregarina niphandrodes TaxID=110365 RepID=A0A023BBV4_GRENI|nr:peptidyl-dipeptidase [Gregarina niphandrodes]EZG80172.1 peptidyl-dipeptidase [Gregarina niphandrodes]|eukprot:XP_011134329.1 peptidyl-dipeptidase [Gregarina niphandrodes]